MADKIHFEVQVKSTQRADHPNSVGQLSKYPAYALVHDDGWNDFGIYANFALWKVESRDHKQLIGELKIICRDNEIPYSELPKQFDNPLPDNFCSLGITSEYYIRLVRNVQDNEERQQLLIYLRDVANDVEINEEFQGCNEYETALVRDLSSQKALKDAKFILAGRNPETAYSFKFKFPVPYKPDISVFWEVKNDYKSKSYKRISGVIGDNGTGKTTMLRNLVADLISNGDGGFVQKPLFNSVNVISSVSVDRYPENVKDSIIPYGNKNLDQTPDIADKIINVAERIAHSRCTINGTSKLELYRDILESWLVRQADNLFTESYDIEKNGTHLTLHSDELRKLIAVLSSGQLHTLALTTYLMADIHLSGLVVIDEPEVHLHPSAIVSFMKVLSDILRVFDSYAVIATHSPLIIREIVNTNVYQIIRTEDDHMLVSRVSFDTFGEDISTLYSKIFGYDESMSVFSELVRRMVKQGKDITKVIDELSAELPMNLNARLRILDLFKQFGHA